MSHNRNVNDPIEQLLREVPFGQSTNGAGEDPIVTLARRMRAVDLSHRSGVRVELRERLQGEKMFREPFSLQRAAAVAALVVFLIAATLLGPGRSFATELLGQLGIVTVTSDDPEFEVDGFNPAEPTATPFNPEELANAPLSTTSEGPYVPVSASEVAQVTGVSPIYEASVIPYGYDFQGWQTMLGDNDAVHISSMWSRMSDNGIVDFLNIIQMRNWPPFTYEAGRDATVESVTIGGYEALVVTNADLESSDGRLFTIIVIEAGEDTLVVRSPNLGPYAAMAIAASLFE